MLRENKTREEKRECSNVLIHYYVQTENQKRETTSVRFIPDLREEFRLVCSQTFNTNHYSRILEAFMQWTVDTFKGDPYVQASLFEAPKRLKRTLDVDQRLEMKMVHKDLAEILQAMEEKRGHEDFRYGKLREVLPKAIRLYESTRNPELKLLLEKSEQWV